MLKQSGWIGFPSGQHKVAMEILMPKSEIETQFELAFVSGEDSLGKGCSTYFVDERLGPVSMLIYEMKPKRAVVLVDSALDLRDAVPRLLEVFSLDPSLVDVPVDLD
jgi:hypothetical protein